LLRFVRQKKSFACPLGGTKNDRLQGEHMIAPAEIFVVMVAFLISPEPVHEGPSRLWRFLRERLPG
jgi:hypothetical protein